MDTTYLTARAAGELTRSTQVILPMNHALTLPGREGGGVGATVFPRLLRTRYR